MAATDTGTCPACASPDVRPVGRLGPVPVLCGSLWDSREEAVATPTAEMDLSICADCAHVWNRSFDPELVRYDVQYDNALDFSPTFRAYADALVTHLVERFDLHGKKVAEIGSGKGSFLQQLCSVGGCAGVGYDPTYEGPDRQGNVEFVRELFTPETSVRRADFVCCRHVLEHLVDPFQFLLDVRAAVRDEPVPMYFEVPNAEFNFGESGPWDLIYPHVSYFNMASLSKLLTRAGFEVLRVGESFGGQFLVAEVVVAEQSSKSRAHQGPRVEAASFVNATLRQLAELEQWRRRIRALSCEGQVAVWGAGSKGVTFLSLIDPDRSVSAVVDSNPRKRGRYLPGPGHQVQSPVDLSLAGIRTVLVMNPVYADEIGAELTALGVSADLIVV